jgi:hypothetical protein
MTKIMIHKWKKKHSKIYISKVLFQLNNQYVQLNNYIPVGNKATNFLMFLASETDSAVAFKMFYFEGTF